MISQLLQAFKGTNTRVPVWFMRQAGRYLPEYRAIREKHGFLTMLQTPAVAAEVTCLPVQRFEVDAAILFADILTLPMAMGFRVEFIQGNGPIIQNPVRAAADLQSIHDMDGVDHVASAIAMTIQNLPAHIPLIGFAGAPFTVLSYLVEGGASPQWARVRQLIQSDSAAFHLLMQTLTRNTIDYLNVQKKSGIHIFQLFDTWAGMLTPSEYSRLALPYVEEIFSRVNLPSIYYLKNCGPLIPFMKLCGADFLSVCDGVDIGTHPSLRTTGKGIQGNLANTLLLSDTAALQSAVQQLLQKATHYPRYIFNLGHGLLPQTPTDAVAMVTQIVHSFEWPHE